MSGCLSSMAAIKIFLLQWKPRMFQEMMLRSLPSCQLISPGCVVLRVLRSFCVVVGVCNGVVCCCMRVFCNVGKSLSDGSAGVIWGGRVWLFVGCYILMPTEPGL